MKNQYHDFGIMMSELNPDIIMPWISSGHGYIHHTAKPFSIMTIEQSLRKDCGKYQHHTMNEALRKYYLTAHIKATVTHNLKVMSGFRDSDECGAIHKEATKDRMQKDEAAVQQVLTVVKERMLIPFKVEDGCSNVNKQPLVNIVDEIRYHLLNIKENGQRELNNCAQDRLVTGNVDFFEPLTKPKLKNFASLNKKVAPKQTQVTKTINIDCQIFSKLVVIVQARQIDIVYLLDYELAPVPLTLFNLDGSMRKTIKSAILERLEKIWLFPGYHQLRDYKHYTL